MGLEANMKAGDSTTKTRDFRQKVLALIAILGLSLVALYAFQSVSKIHGYHQIMKEATYHENKLHSTVISSELSLTVQLNDTQEELKKARMELQNLRRELQESTVQYTKLFSKLKQAAEEMGHSHNVERQSLGDDPYVSWAVERRQESLVPELREFVEPRKLPLGWNPSLETDSMMSSVGHACVANKEDIDNFMTYEIGRLCPDDDKLAQKLLLGGCEPLPRRRCFARGPLNFVEPEPFPESMWTGPPDGSIRWSSYPCKSFECLNSRAAKKVFADCLDCFDLEGREKRRWVGAPGSLDYTMEEVLELKPRLRIGLDIGGGTGSFAARMREHNVTIVTSTLNLGGPFNNFIAHRGIIPIFMSIAQRLPFWDNTLDIVHSMHVLSNWIPKESLEFIFFDIDRVLRPGGVLWLDHFFCVQPELDALYVPMIERLGYKKLKWEVGDKLDRGADKQEVYLSALLEKPLAPRL